MPKERVSVIKGKKESNVMVVAPHGKDDQYTIEMAEAIADLLDCHAVINRGFKRSKVTDTINSRANCNDTDHCINEPVVYEEFAKPILKYAGTCISDDLPCCYIFYLHGINHKTGYDVVFGYGNGIKSNRWTMNPWRVQFLYDALEIEGYQCAMGKAGGNYSARSRKNMTQLFRIDNWVSPYVESLQIEFSGSLRKSAGDAVSTAVAISSLLQNAADAENYSPQRPAYDSY